MKPWSSFTVCRRSSYSPADIRSYTNIELNKRNIGKIASWSFSLTTLRLIPYNRDLMKLHCLLTEFWIFWRDKLPLYENRQAVHTIISHFFYWYKNYEKLTINHFNVCAVCRFKTEYCPVLLKCKKNSKGENFVEAKEKRERRFSLSDFDGEGFLPSRSLRQGGIPHMGKTSW